MFFSSSFATNILKVISLTRWYDIVFTYLSLLFVNFLFFFAYLGKVLWAWRSSSICSSVVFYVFIWNLNSFILQYNIDCVYIYRLIHGLFHIALVISTRPWYRPRGAISVEGWWRGEYEKGHVLIYLSHILPRQITCYCPSQEGR
jgi:hypothetical protein